MYLNLFVCREAQQQQASVQPDPEIVNQLVGMGFSENGSKRAAVATQVQPTNPAIWLRSSVCLPCCRICLYHCHLSYRAFCMLWVHQANYVSPMLLLSMLPKQHVHHRIKLSSDGCVQQLQEAFL